MRARAQGLGWASEPWKRPSAIPSPLCAPLLAPQDGDKSVPRARTSWLMARAHSRLPRPGITSCSVPHTDLPQSSWVLRQCSGERALPCGGLHWHDAGGGVGVGLGKSRARAGARGLAGLEAVSSALQPLSSGEGDQALGAWEPPPLPTALEETPLPPLFGCRITHQTPFPSPRTLQECLGESARLPHGEHGLVWIWPSLSKGTLTPPPVPHPRVSSEAAPSLNTAEGSRSFPT